MTDARDPAAPVPVDAHVHLHDRFEPAAFLDAALANFRAAAPAASPAGVLLLVETADTVAFERLRTGRLSPGGAWRVEETSEPGSLVVTRPGGERIVLVAGSQVVTGNRLEVLTLGAVAPGLDGLPFEEALDRALDLPGGRVAIPWGFGKWWGRRGGQVAAALERYGPRLFLGDNGGRPARSPEPRLFGLARELGVGVLPGSDPLPLPFESGRAGSYGFLSAGPVELETPFASIAAGLQAPDRGPEAFGDRVGWGRFALTQLALRL